MDFRVSMLYGLDVFTDSAVYIGKVKEVEVVVEGERKGKIHSLAVQVLTEEGDKGVKIPYDVVLAVRDIVIVKRHPRLERVSSEREEF